VAQISCNRSHAFQPRGNHWSVRLRRSDANLRTEMKVANCIGERLCQRKALVALKSLIGIRRERIEEDKNFMQGKRADGVFQ